MRIEIKLRKIVVGGAPVRLQSGLRLVNNPVRLAASHVVDLWPALMVVMVTRK